MAKRSEIVVNGGAIRIYVIDMESDLPIRIVGIRVSSRETTHCASEAVSLKDPCALRFVNLMGEPGNPVQACKDVFGGFEIGAITVRENLHALVFAKFANASLVISNLGYARNLLGCNLLADMPLKELPDSVSCAQVR